MAQEEKAGAKLAVELAPLHNFYSAEEYHQKYLDTNPVFDRMKKIGDVGIPAFVFEDGRVSLDPADAGLIEYGSAGACSLEDHKSGRKGC